MAIYVGKRGLLRRYRKKRYTGYKIYGRKGWKYTRNPYITRRVWS